MELLVQPDTRLFLTPTTAKTEFVIMKEMLIPIQEQALTSSGISPYLMKHKLVHDEA
jgi:hypothetical protein